MESFIDELAAAARQDPLAFRLTHLKEPRAIARPEGGRKTVRLEEPAGMPGQTAGPPGDGPRHRLGQPRRRAVSPPSRMSWLTVTPVGSGSSASWWHTIAGW